MYYLIFSLFYLLSLLPWWLMYLLSDGIYLLIYYVIGYRKKVVFDNIAVAFPEKSLAERTAIAKAFYRNFVDTFIETIKLVSISEKEFRKRLQINREVLDQVYATGKSIQVHSAHFFNWEFLNLGIAANSPYRWLGVFTPISNKAFNRIMWDLRSKFGTILIPATEFRTQFHQYAREQYSLGLVADQSPGSPMNAYWTKFFGRMTAFVKGPEKGAKNMDTAIVMADIYKVKRGYYRIDLSLLTMEPRATADGYITKALINFTEECIRKRPDNYLWSHRRWKFPFDAEKYKHLVID